MIEKMNKYSFLMLSGDKESFMDKLQSLGVVDICRSSKPVDEHSAALLSEIESIKAQIKILTNCSDDVLVELSEKLKAAQAKLEIAKVWGVFDPESIGDLKSKGLTLTFHSVKKKAFDPEWKEKYAISVISEDSSTVWFVAVNATDFPVKPIDAPDQSAAQIEQNIKSIEEQIAAHSAELKDRSSEIPELEKQITRKNAELDKYLGQVQGHEAAENSLVIYEGYAPVENKESLCKTFDAEDFIYFCDDANVADNPPIKFRNNRFVKMFEMLTDMYGRPSYDGFDPTPFISIFFLLFFAMCMGDMGYGLVLFLVGFLLKKAGNFAKFAPLVNALGLATIVVGYVFHTFFSVDILTLSWIPDWAKVVMVPSKIAGYDGTMVAALVTGIVHLCLAMIVKTVNETKNKGFLYSLGTWGWTIFWVGLVTIGVISLIGVMDKSTTKIILIVLGIVCAIGIFPLNNLKRNPLVNIGSGLWDTYNMATGMLGDLLSYLRLYALGLAGAMLGFAFNDLAKMALGDGSGVGGWIGFILIVVVGHTLNLAMAALGAFVHPLRLNFLEFFKNSGYDAVGRKYNPLKSE